MIQLRQTVENRCPNVPLLAICFVGIQRASVFSCKKKEGPFKKVRCLTETPGPKKKNLQTEEYTHYVGTISPGPPKWRRSISLPLLTQ